MKRVLIYLLVIMTALSLAGIAPVLAQSVEEESVSDAADPSLGAPPAVGTVVTLPQGDGIAANKLVKAIAEVPTAVDGDGDGSVDDAQAHADIKAVNANDTRWAWITLAVKVGTDQYQIVNNKEFNWNNNGTGGLVQKHGNVVDCNVPGSDVYVTIVTVKRQGHPARSDRSDETSLDVVNC